MFLSFVALQKYFKMYTIVLDVCVYLLDFETKSNEKHLSYDKLASSMLKVNNCFRKNYNITTHLLKNFSLFVIEIVARKNKHWKESKNKRLF